MRRGARLWTGLETARQLVVGVGRGRYWWLIPVLLFLLPLALVLVLLEAVPLVAPFVYTVF